jgi:peroxiredoxin
MLGQPAPDFTLPDPHGTTVTLSSFRGHNAVVLIFYVVDNTPG